MKKTYILVIILALIIVAGLIFANNFYKTDNSDKGIDAKKLKYYGTNVSIGKEARNVWENRTIFLTEKDTKFYCVSDGNETQIIAYPTPYLCPDKITPNCGGLRQALVCGKAYFIYDFSNDYGPRFYGPFDLE
jgi:hypothetical protein